MLHRTAPLLHNRTQPFWLLPGEQSRLLTHNVYYASACASKRCGRAAHNATLCLYSQKALKAKGKRQKGGNRTKITLQKNKKNKNPNNHFNYRDFSCFAVSRVSKHKLAETILFDFYFIKIFLIIIFFICLLINQTILTI
jgi:hypothetical protein